MLPGGLRKLRCRWKWHETAGGHESSPVLAEQLREHGFDAVHWSSIGNFRATDCELLAWAKQHAAIVVTHDLDFGAILAATNADAPSVLQIRTQLITPFDLTAKIVAALNTFAAELEKGALISVDENRARARILPVGR